MKTIRNKLFETNSSSVHTLAISKDNSKVNIRPLESHCNGDYGGDTEYYHDPNDKFDYLIVALRIYKNYENEEDYNKLLDILYDYHVPFKIIYDDTGSIDQPCELTEDIIPNLLSDPDKLIRFLFNDDSYLRTGCDDNCYIDDLNFGVDDPRHIINGEKFDYYQKGN